MSTRIPSVEVGDVVLWYFDLAAQQDAAPAVVTRVGNRTLNLAIVEDGYSNFKVRAGVRHVSDPRSLQDDSDDGYWELTESEKRRRELSDLILGLNQPAEVGSKG